MWHLSHEGSDLEDPWNAPKDELFIVTSTPEKAPDKDEYVELEFEAGVPVAVNGENFLRQHCLKIKRNRHPQRRWHLRHG